MDEIWKSVKEYEGYYEVSNFGNVRSIERDVVRSDGVVFHYPMRMIHPVLNSDGYRQCKLNRNGKYVTKKVHQLVAMAFLPNPNEYKEVNHIDSNRQNNFVGNLEWIDHKSNVRQAIKENRHFCTRDLRGVNNPNYHNTALHDYYQLNPDAKKLLARHGSQNGRAKPIVMYDNQKRKIQKFSYIGECAKYLCDIGVVKKFHSGICDAIANAAKKNKSYKTFYFEFA